MIYTTFRGRLEWSWIKNAPDIGALLGRRYPAFVYRDLEEPGEIVPIFTFHSVEARSFEAACRYLVEGGYRTVAPDELLAIVSGRARPGRRSVMLTFDDGAASLWTVAYPLLRRYGLCATAFVVTSLVGAESRKGPNLGDVWSGRSRLEEVVLRERNGEPFCSWEELREMQDGGVVHVHSHTEHHALVHVGPRIRDFLNPGTDPCHLGHMNLPLVRESGRDLFERPVALGRPLFEARPRMAGLSRFFDDEELRQRCEEFVAQQGGETFFAEAGWRRTLGQQVREHRARFGERGHFESHAECEAAMTEELGRSREIIEARLGQRVEHLCYPWYVGSAAAVEASQRTGYRTNYWGILPGVGAPAPGSDPFRIPRLDARYLPRLPGPSRQSLGRILARHFLPGVAARAVPELSLEPRAT